MNFILIGGSMEQEVKVVLRVANNHTMDIPQGMSELIAFLLEEAGYKGEVEARLSRRRSGSPHCRGVRVGQIRGPNALVVHVQPGDNNTFHDVLLMKPAGDRNILEFWVKLKLTEKNRRNEKKSVTG